MQSHECWHIRKLGKPHSHNQNTECFHHRRVSFLCPFSVSSPLHYLSHRQPLISHNKLVLYVLKFFIPGIIAVCILFVPGFFFFFGRQGLTLTPMLECSGRIIAHCNLELSGSSSPPISTCWVARTNRHVPPHQANTKIFFREHLAVLPSFMSNSCFEVNQELLHASVVHSFCIAEEYFIVWIYHNLFNFSPIDRHFGCFQFWAIKNKATVTVGPKPSFYGCMLVFFLGKLLKNGIGGS